MSFPVKYYIRHGKCDPDKCGAACCKMMKNPSPETKAEFCPDNNGVCRYLKNNRCTIQETKNQICKNFPPDPGDQNYLKVKDKCSYRFEEKVLLLEDEDANDNKG
jgi:hypothetical protein